ncbi:MAG: N-acetylmuramoyl-L-alanine amidase [Rhodococcus sp. (in: high G+C Gram-positive bacteria)]
MHRRPKPPLILGVVAALAVTSPVAVYAIADNTPGVRAANESTTVVPTQIVKMALANAPGIVIPLKQLTGLDLPDIDLGALRDIPIPDSFEIPAIPGITDLEVPAAEPAPLAPAPADVSTDMGAVIKEVAQEAPFSMVALTADQLGAATARVRAQLEDGSWGPWHDADAVDTGRADSDIPATAPGTEPVFVGLTKRVQFLLTPTFPAAAAVNPADPAMPVAPEPAPTPAPAAAPQTDLGYVPASSSRPLRAQPAGTGLVDALTDATAVLITPGTSAADSTLSDIAAPLAGSGPAVISRAQWGADESQRCGSPTYDDSLGGATVHHTAGSNNYTKDESAGIVRAIYAYHARTLGWCDVGYNVLVDKYGQIFEGRAGGLDRNVEGAHAGGFNENTVGLALMGDYSNEQPTEQSLQSAGEFLGWRLGKAGLDPEGTTTMISEGTQYTFVPQGRSIDLPVIFAHRDVGLTECPGDAAYARLDEIRSIAKANLGGAPAPAAPETPIDPETSATDLPTSDDPGAVGGLAAPPSVDAASPSAGSTLTGLVSELLALGVQNPIVQKYAAEGAESGPLGAALTGLLPAAQGQTRADFANGSIYTTPTGQVVSVIGEIFKQFAAMGSGSGTLGLPLTDEYAIPGGRQTDFENGSLIFSEVTGIVTTVVKTFVDTYTSEIDAGAPNPEALTPIPAPEAAPVG